ncbi:unnamed protein product [Blepharisma stoltei]|uniref:Kinesin motor domain-containing protein n=1 Tax=Blepharisma stoltei TaxID=1481888 RepID=A0AAU9JPH8_9CILI|nr:unnamed protein product [Blepharisma stoltei]
MIFWQANGTIFTYGQTGSGKSYTMMGLYIYDPETKGIIPRVSNLIFTKLQESTCEIEYSLKCSIIEIYKESLRDLLSDSGVRLKIKEDPKKGAFVQGLEEVYVVCEEELMNIIALVESKRTVASTKLNEVSSRSHQLFVLEVNQKLPDDTEKRGIVNFIDLAGSEKVKESGVTGNKLEEAKNINLSLSCLSNVINALSSKADFIPYRDSKLTRLLQESLGGNYKTTLIVNCNPDPRNVEVTINTLKFAQRVKNIKNNVKLNIKKSPAAYSQIINELRHKIQSLK